MKKKVILVLTIILVLSLSACGCTSQVDRDAARRMRPITLNYWRVFDGQDDFKEIIDAYNARHPNIKINYRRFRYDEYEMAILHALAEDRGPDILSIHNTWVRKYQSKLAEMPERTIMAQLVDVGTLKSEIIPQTITNVSPSIQQIRNAFVDVVASDVILENKVYALPLSVDTLAMYYNRDLLNQARITEPQKFWNRTFQENVRDLTRQDINLDIVQSGIALGGHDNIERATDILSILMMQNGATMMSGGSVTFQRIPAHLADSGYNPGLNALRFYIDFASPNKEVYAWNDTLPNSVEMFSQGNLAIMFGYSYHLPIIKSLAPRLNFSIAKLPQIEGAPEVNFANYWVEAVSAKSEYINEAWDFIKFATSEQRVVSYLDKTNKPPALRSLIDSQIEKNEEIAVFIDQLFTAKSWYKGKNPEAAEAAMLRVIREALNDEENLMNILNAGASRVNQTIN